MTARPVTRFAGLAAVATLALGPGAPPAFAAMPAPSAAASAHCPEIASVHVDQLPASAWAPVAYPDKDEAALRARGKDQHAPKGPSLRVFRRDLTDPATYSVVAERTGGTWTLAVTEEKNGIVASRRATLNPDRARNLNRILADACFWAEPTEVSSTTAEAACIDAMDLWLEAVTPDGRRIAVQHCSPVGLTGEAAEILWNEAKID